MAFTKLSFKERKYVDIWLKERLKPQEGVITTNDIIEALNEDLGVNSGYRGMIDWYLFEHGFLAKEDDQDDNNLIWDGISLIQQAEDLSKQEKTEEVITTNPGKDVVNADYINPTETLYPTKTEHKKHLPSEPGKTRGLFAEMDRKEQQQYRKEIESRDDNTIEISRKKRKATNGQENWIGLALWLTNRGFKESETTETSLKELMDYHTFDKPKRAITYEFLRDRLLYDGFKESYSERPIEERCFNVSQPEIELRRAFRESKRKKRG